MTNPCLTCEFARWQRTAAGKLHPSGDGRCAWKMPEIALPKAFYWGSMSSGTPTPWGGNIERKRDDNRECAAYLPALQEVKP